MSHCIACYVKEKETEAFPDNVVKLVDEKGEVLSSVSKYYIIKIKMSRVLCIGHRMSCVKNIDFCVLPVIYF